MKITKKHIGLYAWQPTQCWRPVHEELVKQGLQLVLDSTYHPLILMCPLVTPLTITATTTVCRSYLLLFNN